MSKSIDLSRASAAFLTTSMLLAISGFLGTALPARAQSEPDIDVGITIGFDEHCKFGNWLPIHILLKAQDADFTGNLSIAYSQAEYLIPVDLTENAQKSISTQIFTNVRDVNQVLTFRLIPETHNDAPIFLDQVNLTCFADRIIGVITNTPSAFTLLNALQPANTTDVVVLSYEGLPKNVLGFQSLDALIIANTDVSDLDPDQYEAIKLWVMQGGHLIFGGGAQWQTTISGFEELLPLLITGSRSTNILTGFSAFNAPLELSEIILIEGTQQPGSRILLQDDGQPLVAQRAYGSGTVSLLTFDPNIYDFRRSPNAVLFYDYLLLSVSDSYDFTSIKDWNSAIAAVSLFQNQNLPALWYVSGALLLYIVLLGPVHFWVLKSKQRPDLAWITLPIIAFSLTAIVIVIVWGSRGTKPQINQLAVVHQWPGYERAFSSGMAGIFSPQRKEYQIQVEAGFSSYPFAPHNYFDTPNNQWAFRHTNQFIADTLINASEIMPVGILGWVPALPIRSDLDLILESSTAVLSGEIQNESSIDLENAILFYPGGFELIGTIGSGESVHIDLPIDLLSQRSSNANTILYSTVYNPTTYYGSVIREKIAPDTLVARNTIQQQIDLIEAVLGNYTVPPVGFLLVGWDATQISHQISLPGEEFDTNSLTAYMVSLPIDAVSSKNQMIIPPALFNWFITEDSSLRYANPYKLRFGYQDHVDIYYRLAQPVSYSDIVEIIIHLEGQDSRPDFPLNIFLWNFDQEQWDRYNVRNWNAILISDPSAYVDKNLTEVRIKLVENGNGGGIVNVSRVDISLVVEP